MSELKLEKDLTYITPEIRALVTPYTDPLSLNFKLMINYDRPSGLFADESVTDSALAYLNRIGEVERYTMLKKWIEIVKDFIKNYDFLIMTCDGIETITNVKPSDFFTDEDKLTFSIRETIDMRFQSILTIYRQIWFDDVRKVEVIPMNLRRFDVFVLVYASGYYNMIYYDAITESINSTADPDGQILPTLNKLADGFFNPNSATPYKFNHHLISLKSCWINNEESGKTFFESLTNEQAAPQVKNTLVLNYRFAFYSGVFNNIIGNFDFVKLLAVSAAQDKLSNSAKASWLQQMKDAFKNQGSNVLNGLKDKIKQAPKKFISTSTPIGNALHDFTDPTSLATMSRNTVDLGINAGEDYINNNVTKLDNLIMQNFSDDFVNAYKNALGPEIKNKPTLFTDQTTPIDSITTDNVNKSSQNKSMEKNIKYEVVNIYKRSNF